MDPTRPLVIGTRGSKLALAQANQVRDALVERHCDTGLQIELEILETTGDVSRGSLSDVGGQGVFTREIERALLDERVDLAVHSLKDLPTRMDPGLSLVAVPPRQDVRDTLVLRTGQGLGDLPQGATVGTGSLRRQGQVRALRPDLRFEGIRGNVDTRLGRVRDGEVDAVVLAAAGLHRLGLHEEISAYLDTDQVLPAPGQGALGLQMRTGDARRDVVAALTDAPSWLAVRAERSLLETLGAGCHAPVGAWARQLSDELRLDAVVCRPDGTDLHRATATVSLEQGEGDEAAADLGRGLAEKLLSAGADQILRDTAVAQASGAQAGGAQAGGAQAGGAPAGAGR